MGNPTRHFHQSSLVSYRISYSSKYTGCHPDKQIHWICNLDSPVHPYRPDNLYYRCIAYSGEYTVRIHIETRNLCRYLKSKEMWKNCLSKKTRILLQSRSSAASMQSYFPSQIASLFTHRPLPHWNCPGRQQFSSSSFCGQSMTPLHTEALDIQSPEY